MSPATGFSAGCPYQMRGRFIKMSVLLSWENYMALIAIFSLSSWLPQIARIMQTKDTHSFSLVTTAILIIVNGSWLAYSFTLGSWPFILQQVLTCLMLFIFAILVVRYRSPHNAGNEVEDT